MAVLSILSGGVVPLALFPEGVARVFGLLPFAGMVSVPLNIFLGKYRLEECMGYMGLQIFWCIIMGAFVVSYGDSESDCPRRIEE